MNVLNMTNKNTNTLIYIIYNIFLLFINFGDILSPGGLNNRIFHILSSSTFAYFFYLLLLMHFLEERNMKIRGDEGEVGHGCKGKMIQLHKPMNSKCSEHST